MDSQLLLCPKRGRPQAIPATAYSELFRLYSLGLGYRAIADRLAEMRICYPTKSSVERCLKGWGCYSGRRIRR